MTEPKSFVINLFHTLKRKKDGNHYAGMITFYPDRKIKYIAINNKYILHLKTGKVEKIVRKENL